MLNRKDIFKISIFIYLLVNIFPAHSQKNKIDSLHIQLKTSQSDTSRIKLYLKLSMAYMYGSHDSALFYAKEAYNLSKKNNNYKLDVAGLRVGEGHCRLGENEKSIQVLLEALNEAKSKKNKKTISLILGAIGRNYLRLNDNESALDYYTQAFEQSNNYSSKFVSLTNIAQIYAVKLNFPESHKYYDRALELAEKENVRKDLAILYHCIGNLYNAEKSPEKAISYFNKSIQFSDSTEKELMVSNLRGTSISYIYKKQYTQAISSALKADTVAKKEKYIYECRYINESLKVIYESLGNYQKAYHYQKLYQQYNDSIFNIERNNKISSLMEKYKAKEKELKIEGLENRARISRYIIIISILISILFIFILLYIYRSLSNKNKLLNLEREKEVLVKQKMELKLDKKYREILTQSIQISNQKKLFTDINTKLKDSLKLIDHGKFKTSIKKLCSELDSSIALQDDWEQIKLHFEKVHPDFFNNLKQNYPILTVNDLKLCAYTKLKFNKKDIGRLLNITSGSVHIARYRLKKKMQVQEGVDFDSFVLHNF